MLVLYLELKGHNPEDIKRFEKIKGLWRKNYVEDKIKQIKRISGSERITIENGLKYFAVHSWLKD